MVRCLGYKGHTGHVRSLAFAPSGMAVAGGRPLLASGSVDSTVGPLPAATFSMLSYEPRCPPPSTPPSCPYRHPCTLPPPQRSGQPSPTASPHLHSSLNKPRQTLSHGPFMHTY